MSAIKEYNHLLNNLPHDPVPTILATPITPSTSNLTFDVLCSLPFVGDCFSGKLEDLGLHHNRDASLKLIIDMQQGFALHLLEAQSTMIIERSHLKLVVLTFSQCAEYWEDLWDLQPDILVVNPTYEYEIATAIARAARGDQYRTLPKGSTPLNINERAILRHLVRGWFNRQIADQLRVNNKTVMNRLTSIYDKIGVKTREEAMVYYWDLSHIFKSEHCLELLAS